MKTPGQIADEQTKYDHDAVMVSADYMREKIVAAIEADRAQRDPNEDGALNGAAIIALRERADSDLDHADAPNRAAEWIENNPDEFWERYVGPMLDEIEGDFR